MYSVLPPRPPSDLSHLTPITSHLISSDLPSLLATDDTPIEQVASFAILADDNRRWRPDRFGYKRWGTKVGIRFPAVKLLDYLPRRAELEQSSNPFATFVLAHLDTLETRQDQNERKDSKFRLVKGLYERGWNREQIEELFRLIDWIMELPTEMERGER